jgi:hypothetical protein
MQCPEASGDGTACLGPSAIVRMSFILAIFHLVVFCVLLARNTAASIFHDGCWGTKVLIVFLGFCVSLYIPNSFFQGYMDFSRYVSILFLILQAMLMLIVAYKINSGLIANYENEAPANGLGCSGAIIVLITLVFTAGNITWVVYQYIWNQHCASSVSIITITLAACIGFYVIVIFRTR